MYSIEGTEIRVSAPTQPLLADGSEVEDGNGGLVALPKGGLGS